MIRRSRLIYGLLLGIWGVTVAWQVVEPMKTWHLTLGPNPTGLELDLTWLWDAPPAGTPPNSKPHAGT